MFCQWIIPVFWAIKVVHFDLMKNNMAALNNERVVQIDFMFLAYYPELNFFFCLVTEFIT